MWVLTGLAIALGLLVKQKFDQKQQEIKLLRSKLTLLQMVEPDRDSTLKDLSKMPPPDATN